jgi:hypothetical protein
MASSPQLHQQCQPLSLELRKLLLDRCCGRDERTACVVQNPQKRTGGETDQGPRPILSRSLDLQLLVLNFDDCLVTGLLWQVSRAASATAIEQDRACVESSLGAIPTVGHVPKNCLTNSHHGVVAAGYACGDSCMSCPGHNQETCHVALERSGCSGGEDRSTDVTAELAVSGRRVERVVVPEAPDWTINTWPLAL